MVAFDTKYSYFIIMTLSWRYNEPRKSLKVPQSSPVSLIDRHHHHHQRNEVNFERKGHYWILSGVDSIDEPSAFTFMRRDSSLWSFLIKSTTGDGELSATSPSR